MGAPRASSVLSIDDSRAERGGWCGCRTVAALGDDCRIYASTRHRIVKTERRMSLVVVDLFLSMIGHQRGWFGMRSRYDYGKRGAAARKKKTLAVKRGTKKKKGCRSVQNSGPVASD